MPRLSRRVFAATLAAVLMAGTAYAVTYPAPATPQTATPAFSVDPTTGKSAASGSSPVTATFTRPANTTAYTSGAIVCNSASPTVCTPLTFTVPSTGFVTQGRLILNSTVTTNASFTIHLYDAAPTLTGLSDDSAFSPLWADAAHRVGSFTCSTPVANTDNVTFDCSSSNSGNPLNFAADGSSQLYAVLQVNGAYVPTSGEQVLVRLGIASGS